MLTENAIFLEPAVDSEYLCRDGDFPPAGRVSALASLEKLGFYRFVDTKKLKTFVSKTIYTGELDELFSAEVLRSCEIDNENVYEQGIRPFIDDTKECLARFGFHLTLTDEKWDNSNDLAYHVEVNDIKFLVWDSQTFRLNFDSQYLATHRVVRIANYLLIEAGIAERIYTLAGGDSCFAMFLTKEIIDTLRKYRILLPVERFCQ